MCCADVDDQMTGDAAAQVPLRHYFSILLNASVIPVCHIYVWTELFRIPQWLTDVFITLTIGEYTKHRCGQSRSCVLVIAYNPHQIRVITVVDDIKYFRFLFINFRVCLGMMNNWFILSYYIFMWPRITGVDDCWKRNFSANRTFSFRKSLYDYMKRCRPVVTSRIRLILERIQVYIPSYNVVACLCMHSSSPIQCITPITSSHIRRTVHIDRSPARYASLIRTISHFTKLPRNEEMISHDYHYDYARIMYSIPRMSKTPRSPAVWHCQCVRQSADTWWTPTSTSHSALRDVNMSYETSLLWNRERHSYSSRHVFFLLSTSHFVSSFFFMHCLCLLAAPPFGCTTQKWGLVHSFYLYSGLDTSVIIIMISLFPLFQVLVA